ncbi:MAG TPA: SpoIID/LytB domain-containing protein, partial [Thermoanaerobaculia bacterium]
MNRRLFLTVLLGLAAPLRTLAAAARPRRILRLKNGAVEEVPLEDYVAAVLPPEIGRAPAAALEAQAVAARSYAVARAERHLGDGADLCDGTHCQVFRGLAAATEESHRAAAATRGLVLMQAGRVI